MNKCYFCGFESSEKIYRNSLCSNCKKDLKVCLNCIHYDTGASNQCREPQAEKVVDKDRANFCDFFVPSGRDSSGSQNRKAEEAKQKLEDLFS